MDEILKSIDARDSAVLLWLGLMLVVVNRKSEVRKAFGGFWRAFTHYKILIAIVFAAAITALLCYCLYVVGIWSVNQLKGCVVWFLAACIPSMMDIPKLSEDFSLFKKAALKNFELSVFVSFYLNLFKGTLWIELVLVPVAVALGCMLVLVEKREDLKHTHGFVARLVAILGFFWIAFQTYKLFTSFDEIRNVDTIRNFVLPTALNLAFLPFLTLYAAYAAYESIFARVQFVVKDPSIRRFTKFALLSRCGLNYMRAHRWFRCAQYAELNSRSDVWKSIGEA